MSLFLLKKNRCFNYWVSILRYKHAKSGNHYYYYDHLKRLGFIWEYTPIQFKYEVTLSTDEKTLKKKLLCQKLQGKKYRQIKQG